MKRRWSLRTRLLMAVGAVALTALVVAGFATYSALRSFLYDRLDQSLDSAHLALVQALDGNRAPGETTVAALAPGTYVELRSSDNRIIGVSGARRRGDRPMTPRLPPAIGGLGGLEGDDGSAEPHRYFSVGPATPGGPDFRIRASRLRTGDQLVLAVPLDDTTATLRRLVWIEMGVGVSGLIAAVGLGWWLVRVGLRPLADVEETAAAIADGALDRRVPGEDATEVGRLAAALNTMMERIQEAFAARDATEARLRQFVSDASHELRTPVAAVAAYAELFDRGASDRPVDLARVMAGIRFETGRMGELVDDLLLLARLDEGRPLERAPVELVSVAAQAVDAAVTMGPQWPVTLRAEKPTEVSGDRARLRQVIDNLLSNVRAHTPPGTAATVRISDDGEEAVIEVQDDGPGMPQDAVGRIFERFYRVDVSRSRERGGSGLGLAIVFAIVAAHDGQISADSALSAGAKFTIRLPLHSPVDQPEESGRIPAAG